MKTQSTKLKALSHAQVDALVGSETVKFGKAVLTNFRSDEGKIVISATVISKKNGEVLDGIKPFDVYIAHVGMDERCMISFRRKGISTAPLLEVALSDVVLDNGITLDKVV